MRRRKESGKLSADFSFCACSLVHPRAAFEIREGWSGWDFFGSIPQALIFGPGPPKQARLLNLQAILAHDVTERHLQPATRMHNSRCAQLEMVPCAGLKKPPWSVSQINFPRVLQRCSNSTPDASSGLPSHLQEFM